MIDQTEWRHGVVRYRQGTNYVDIDYLAVVNFFGDSTFTRSDGSMFSRIYERLTKASRRREPDKEAGWYSPTEQAYRHGVKDTLTALRRHR